MRMNDHGTQCVQIRSAYRQLTLCFITFDLRISMHSHRLTNQPTDRPTVMSFIFDWRNNGISIHNQFQSGKKKKSRYKWYTCCRAHTQYIIYAQCDCLHCNFVKLRCVSKVEENSFFCRSIFFFLFVIHMFAISLSLIENIFIEHKKKD